MRTHGARLISELPGRIRSLAGQIPVHIYAVLHDSMSDADLDWLRDLQGRARGTSSSASSVPRPFGRFTPLSNDGVLQYALELADERCSVKTTSSKTRSVTVDGTERMSS